MEEYRNTLRNNKIVQFILRIDLDQNIKIDYGLLAQTLLPEYSTSKIEVIHNTNLDVISGDISKKDFNLYVLLSDDITLKIDSFNKSIIFEANHYINKSIYQSRITRITEVLQMIVDGDILARRIGMRFVNVFPCNKMDDIGKIYNVDESRSIRNSLKKNQISRSVFVNEFQLDGFRIRVQYGVPNKYYPAIITNYDLVLDIDVYSDGLQEIEYWENSISDFNHAAFEMFSEYTKESFRNSMQ